LTLGRLRPDRRFAGPCEDLGGIRLVETDRGDCIAPNGRRLEDQLDLVANRTRFATAYSGNVSKMRGRIDRHAAIGRDGS
jgi:hypothetical protein